MNQIKTFLTLGFICFFAFAGGMPAFAKAVGDCASAPEGNNAFAVDLYRQISKEGGNLFFSPFSVSTALAMTAAGAKGKTESEMVKTLHFPCSGTLLNNAYAELLRRLEGGGKKGLYKLDIANRLWGEKKYKFQKTFLNTTKKYYNAPMEMLNFAGNPEGSRLIVNRWVEKKTEGKIRDLLKKGDVSGATALILTNAIYFKGTWKYQFAKSQTQNLPFDISSGKKVNVPMMHQAASFQYKDIEGGQILGMPYNGDDLSMIVALPSKKTDFRAFEKNLSSQKIEKWIKSLDNQRVNVFLPKFKMSSRFNLSETLASLGMKTAFEPGVADFSGMTGSKDLAISKVIHKAYVDVNEEGTEAAAATAVTMTKSIPMPPKLFRADHPFIFFIVDNKSGSIMFMGRVANPAG